MEPLLEVDHHLVGKLCLLTRWKEDYVEEIVQHANNIKVWRNLLDVFPHPYTLEHAKEWIAHNKGDAMVRGCNFAICITEGPDQKVRPVGGVGFKKLQGSNYRRTVELGYWLGESYWGRGITTEAVKLILEYAWSSTFTHVNAGEAIERVQACTFVYNKASARVLEKNGFEREGILRRTYVKEGKNIDGMMYSILRSGSGSG